MSRDDMPDGARDGAPAGEPEEVSGGVPGEVPETDHDVASGGLPVPDAPPDGAPSGVRGGGDDSADPVAAEVGAVFAAALADEPESSVTPLTVLHAVRDERRDRSNVRWSREWAVWKWGGGVAAVAAAVGAVLILGPVVFSHQSASTASGSADSAAGSMFAQSAEGSASSKAPVAAAIPGAPDATAGSRASSDQAGAESGTQFGIEAAPNAAAASPPTGSAPSAAAGAATAESSSASSPCAQARLLPVLTNAETAAVARVLHSGSAMAEVGATSCDPTALRGLGFAVGSTELYLVVASDAEGSTTVASAPGTGATPAGPQAQAPEPATARGHGLVVTASAFPVGQTRLSHAQLADLAAAVLAAALP